MSDNQAIIVVVLGGMVQDVRFPDGCRTAVSIHDYDVARGLLRGWWSDQLESGEVAKASLNEIDEDGCFAEDGLCEEISITI